MSEMWPIFSIFFIVLFIFFMSKLDERIDKKHGITHLSRKERQAYRKKLWQGKVEAFSQTPLGVGITLAFLFFVGSVILDGCSEDNPNQQRDNSTQA